MNIKYTVDMHNFWDGNSFHFLKPEEYQERGINPDDIPAGTFAALKHPSQLLSRFGGNAYGFGFVEGLDRLDEKEIELIQGVASKDINLLRKHYRDINSIYKKMGLLIRISSYGEPYYLIPSHMLSMTLDHIKSKVDEISKIADFHRRKYQKEHCNVGMMLFHDDLILQELSLRFKDYNFVPVDSLERLRSLDSTLDIFILTAGIYETIMYKKLGLSDHTAWSKQMFFKYANYILAKIYNILKPDGEIFVIARKYTPRTNKTTTVVFNTETEAKKFALFTHIFKTRKRYTIDSSQIQVNIFDFQNYVNGIYVEHDIVDDLVKGKKIEDMSLREIERLPYLDFPIPSRPFSLDQEETWKKLFSTYFDQIFLKPIIPRNIQEKWKKRFYCIDYEPSYMLAYLGQKRGIKGLISQAVSHAKDSELAGCNPTFLADYKDSFEYVIETLRVLERLSEGSYDGSPRILVDRLRNPLESKDRRYPRLNTTIRLVKKIKRLEKIREYLNPGGIEGTQTKVLDNLEILTLFGFNHDELKEIIYIILGHSPMGRILSGKINERSLKPLLNLAKHYDLKTALNLLRYCRLMTLAEIEAERGYKLTREELIQLFDLYELAVRMLINKDPGLDTLLDEEISSMGGIHNKVIRKLLMMASNYEFLENWTELNLKGPREKESLADYDHEKLARIENVISLLNSVEMFESRFLATDPLALPTFYRKFLDIEFHGTGHLFKMMEGRDVTILLWFAINAARNGVVNFNPMMADVKPHEAERHVEKISREVKKINTAYLGLDMINDMAEQLHEHGITFIAGTGFKLTVDPDTKAIEVHYMDMDKDIMRFEALLNKVRGYHISSIPKEDIKRLEVLFANLDSFYKSHLIAQEKNRRPLKLPKRELRWFKKIANLREETRKIFLENLFHPELFYSDFNHLYNFAPTILNFIIPELGGLKDLDFSWHVYMKSPVIHYILTTLRKLQALITHERNKFQDADYLHRLAKREFGPMATGTIGLSDQQLKTLEDTVSRLRTDTHLFDALLRAFVFQDIGRLPSLRKKYEKELNPADLGETGVLFLEKENIPEQYGLDKKGKGYLTFFVKHHSLIHHIMRGEMSFFAIKSILEPRDKKLMDCFLVFSLIMLSAIRDDLVIEDLAEHILKTKDLCDRIIEGKTTLDEHMNNKFAKKGYLFHALREFKDKGLPEGVNPVEFLRPERWQDTISREEAIRAGRLINATERIFYLRGIMHVGFEDIAHYALKVPMKFIYKRKKFSSIGFPTFEREVYEAYRIYKTMQSIDRDTRHYILEKLSGDKVRLFGYEKVSNYLSYKNQIKLLLMAFIGSDLFSDPPVLLNFLPLCQIIEKRYEAMNNYLNTVDMEKIGRWRADTESIFRNRTGILLNREPNHNVITLRFKDDLNIPDKIAYMQRLNDVNRLKDFYHQCLLKLHSYTFYTDDYVEELSDAYYKKFKEITDQMLLQAKNQMNFINDFRELYELFSHLSREFAEIGLADEQIHRLLDIYELRKEVLKKEKLDEIEETLANIHTLTDLDTYWNVLKRYLKNNRQFFGKEFEKMVSRRLDQEEKRIRKEGV